LLKKVPGQVAIQSLSKRAQDSVMVALGKLLAESICAPGQAVVQKTFPPCADEVDYSGVQSTRAADQPHPMPNCTAGFDRGITNTHFINYYGQPLGPPLTTVLCDAGGSCVRLRIVSVNAFIEWGYCDGTVKDLGRPVESESDIAGGDAATARQAVAQFNAQIERLEEIITAYTKARKQGQTEYIGDFPTLNNGFYSLEGILAHESSHRDSAYIRIKNAVDKVEKENVECVSPNLTPAERLQKETKLALKLFDYESNLRETGKNRNELAAHTQEKGFLEKLVWRIEKAFHL
jgi:hypothetical protein